MDTVYRRITLTACLETSRRSSSRSSKETTSPPTLSPLPMPPTTTLQVLDLVDARSRRNDWGVSRLICARIVRGREAVDVMPVESVGSSLSSSIRRRWSWMARRSSWRSLRSCSDARSQSTFPFSPLHSLMFRPRCKRPAHYDCLPHEGDITPTPEAHAESYFVDEICDECSTWTQPLDIIIAWVEGDGSLASSGDTTDAVVVQVLDEKTGKRYTMPSSKDPECNAKVSPFCPRLTLADVSSYTVPRQVARRELPSSRMGLSLLPRRNSPRQARQLPHEGEYSRVRRPRRRPRRRRRGRRRRQGRSHGGSPSRSYGGGEDSQGVEYPRSRP